MKKTITQNLSIKVNEYYIELEVEFDVTFFTADNYILIKDCKIETVTYLYSNKIVASDEVPTKTKDAIMKELDFMSVKDGIGDALRL